MTPAAPAAPAPAPPLPDVASRLRMAVMRLARRLRLEGLGEQASPPMVSALATVDRFGPLTLGDLAAAEHVQPPSMTKIVARLEASGFVVREVDADDRRVARVRVTPAGHRYVERARSRGSAYIASRLRGFSPEERERIEAALPLLERLLEDVG